MRHDGVIFAHNNLTTVKVQLTYKCATLNIWSSHIGSQLYNKSQYTTKAVGDVEETYKKNTEGIISAKTVCTISSSYLCTFIAFSPCGETLRLLGMLLFPPGRFLSLLNVTGALGAQITLESCIFLCRFASGLKLQRMEGGGISYPRQEKWSHLSSWDLGNVSTR